jgi:hypothetical protein
MARSWQELTQSEKIEELRKDIERTMTAINKITRQLTAVGLAFDDLYARMKVVEARLP